MSPRPNDMGERLWCLPCAMLDAPMYVASPGGMTRIRRAGSLVLLLVLTASVASAGDRATAYGLWCGVKAADLATTEYGLSRGAREANPLMQNRAVRVGVGVSSCIVAAEVDHKLRKHKKSRWALRIVGIGLLSYAAVHNARVAR